MNGGVYYLKNLINNFKKKNSLENDIILPLIKEICFMD